MHDISGNSILHMKNRRPIHILQGTNVPPACMQFLYIHFTNATTDQHLVKSGVHVLNITSITQCIFLKNQVYAVHRLHLLTVTYL